MDLADVKLTEDGSDDMDTFEDVPEIAIHPTSQHLRSGSNASIRSLTGQRDGSVERERRPANIISDLRPVQTFSEEVTPRVSSHQQDANRFSEDLISPKGNVLTIEHDPEPSPLLTARRITAFDHVRLGDTKARAEEERYHSVPADSVVRSSLEHSESKSPTSPSDLLGANSTNPAPSVLPDLPSALPSVPPSQSKQLAAAVMSRKLSSPFSWLSRKKTAVTGTTSPPNARRHTAATMNHAGSNPDFLLHRLEDKPPAKEQLKERFKVLRMKEEIGIDLAKHTPRYSGSSNGRVPSDFGLGINGSSTVDDGQFSSPRPTDNDPIPPSRSNSIASVHFDPNLAPGTVSGISSGPSAMQDPEVPVDWDLWQSVVYDGPAAVAKTSAAELNRAIASGIPNAIRGVVWQVLAQSKNEELEGVYRELIARGTDKEKSFDPPHLSSGPHSANSITNGTQKESVASSASSTHSEASTSITTSATTTTTNDMISPTASQEIEAINVAKVHALAERQRKSKEDLVQVKRIEKTIRKDLGARSNYSKYTAAAGLQEGLFGVCKAYALFDEGVGYAQGMNFIVMPLLFNMPEEEAFCLLVRLMNQYQLRDMFTQDMPGLHLHLYQFERLLEDIEPALCYHLHKRGITPALYATQWFLTLFAYRFPLQLVLRVYDLILSEGLEGAILKFGIALMQKNAESLLSMQDMSALKIFLNERLFDVYIDASPSANSILESGFFGNSGGMEKEVYRADLMVQDACAVKLTPELLKAYTSDYESRIRLEKEREAEFDNLRTANASLASRIRILEQRAEKSDTDHVQMATEMIKSKMENEELRVTNEEMQGHIIELKSVVDVQPAQIERQLKDEMERIMTRNIEVQNENRALEEQLADVERDLVETKMKFAQINSDHDSLKQKWTDLRRALGD